MAIKTKFMGNSSGVGFMVYMQLHYYYCDVSCNAHQCPNHEITPEKALYLKNSVQIDISIKKALLKTWQ